MLVHNYVDETAQLPCWPPGVTPDVNLRIVLHTGDEAYKPGDPTLALKRSIDVT